MTHRAWYLPISNPTGVLAILEASFVSRAEAQAIPAETQAAAALVDGRKIREFRQRNGPTQNCRGKSDSD